MVDGGFRSWQGLFLRLQIIIGPARRTRYRLRMEAAVACIPEFFRAIIIERPVFHRGVAAVIRQTEDHGVARAAVGAVDVGITVARITGIEEFFEAILAHRQVRRNP